MDNKVTQTLARIFLQLGYIVTRSNFRGVGATEGSYDNGHGETDDLLAVLAHMRTQPDQAPLPLVLAGFSFGTFVLSQVGKRYKSAARRSSGWCSSARPRADGRWTTCQKTLS